MMALPSGNRVCALQNGCSVMWYGLKVLSVML